jgi:hypothetical protein
LTARADKLKDDGRRKRLPIKMRVSHQYSTGIAASPHRP